MIVCNFQCHMIDEHKKWKCFLSIWMGKKIHQKLIVAVLHSRWGHYIFVLWFLLLSSVFSLPNLSHRRLDVCHTSTHDVALM